MCAGQSSVTKVAHLLNTVSSNLIKIGTRVLLLLSFVRSKSLLLNELQFRLVIIPTQVTCEIEPLHLIAGKTACVVVYSERKKGFYTCDRGELILRCVCVCVCVCKSVLLPDGKVNGRGGKRPRLLMGRAQKAYNS